MKSRGGKSQRREEKRREEKRRKEERKKKTREEKEPEETARRKKMQVAKRSKKSREALWFYNVLGPRMVKKYACQSGGRGAIWLEESGKSLRRCGAKRVSKPKCTKHTILRAPFEVRMWFCMAGARDSE